MNSNLSKHISYAVCHRTHFELLTLLYLFHGAHVNYEHVHKCEEVLGILQFKIYNI